MINIMRRKSFYLMIIGDSCLVGFSYLLAYLLRFEFRIPGYMWTSFRSSVLYVIAIKLLVFMLFGLYKGMWRYTSLVDLIDIIKATIVSSGIISLLILFLYRFEGFPRSVFVIDAVLTLVFISGLRAAIRLHLSGNGKYSFFRRKPDTHMKRLLIIGAGDAGEKMLREINENPQMHYQVVGFLDDDPQKHGMHIHGVPVLGSVPDIRRLALRNVMDEILIAIPSASANKMRTTIAACEASRRKFRIIPGIGEMIDGKISFQSIREVSFEDLIGREPIDFDMKSIGNYLAGKTILVTGAAGSIGSELCRQISPFQPKELILFDKGENNLFHIEMEFRQAFPRTPIIPVLGDVKNKLSLQRHFERFKPQVVFHAAAYKHVPIVELHPWEGVFNNIVGTKNALDISSELGVERFLLVSTDKAVRPGNVMGATKRVAEMLTSSFASSAARYVSVRFGNVIGSEGSVVHLFKKQIERFGPVTVTDPEITRYFMTIPEACKLILQAGAMGEGGEIFILDMGTPVKILDLAKNQIRRSGFIPGEEIEIKFVGLRPGEKLHEELITKGEGIIRTTHGKILALKGLSFDYGWLSGKIDELTELARDLNGEGIKSKLKEIVTDYQPYESGNPGSSSGL